MPKAFITGCGGQDGSYLAEHLLDQGYRVKGLVRPSGDDRLARLKNILDHPRFSLHYGDVCDIDLLHSIADAKFDEIYHLAALSHVAQSYNYPTFAMEVNTTPTLRLLELLLQKSPTTKFYFAATSEMFGDMSPPTTATEDYQLGARSPYAMSKIASHLACRIYRHRGLFTVSGISFNHESCRRGAQFVTRKLGLGVRHFLETGKQVSLGNLQAMRDWHHAKDTVRGMWLAMQHDVPDEYIFASGTPHTVGELADAVCDHFATSARDAITISPAEIRPWDVEYLCGDATKAHTVLGWQPEVMWPELVADVCRPRESV